MKGAFLLRWSARAALVIALVVASACLPIVATTIRFRTPPVLVAVAPGIWVVEDSPRSVFYVEDHYWYEEGGLWYCTSSYHGHWVRVGSHAVPLHIRSIDGRRYRYYRAPAGALVRRASEGRPVDGGTHHRYASPRSRRVRPATPARERAR